MFVCSENICEAPLIGVASPTETQVAWVQFPSILQCLLHLQISVRQLIKCISNKTNGGSHTTILLPYSHTVGSVDTVQFNVQLSLQPDTNRFDTHRCWSGTNEQTNNLYRFKINQKTIRTLTQWRKTQNREYKSFLEIKKCCVTPNASLNLPFGRLIKKQHSCYLKGIRLSIECREV